MVAGSGLFQLVCKNPSAVVRLKGSQKPRRSAWNPLLWRLPVVSRGVDFGWGSAPSCAAVVCRASGPSTPVFAGALRRGHPKILHPKTFLALPRSKALSVDCARFRWRSIKLGHRFGDD